MSVGGDLMKKEQRIGIILIIMFIIMEHFCNHMLYKKL